MHSSRDDPLVVFQLLDPGCLPSTPESIPHAHVVDSIALNRIVSYTI